MAVQRILRDENVTTACLIVGGGIFTYLYASDTLLSKYYVQYTQKQRNNASVPIRNKSKFRFESVLDELKISKFKRDYYDLFITDNLDPITLGAISVRQGIKIGIPEHYQKSSPDDIKITVDKVRGKPINWSSEYGEKFLQSLQLSEGAQKFALAKAVLMANNYYYLFRALLPPFFICGFFSASQTILSRRKLHLRSSLFTIGTYVLTSTIFLALYSFSNEALFLQYDKISDEEALDVSQEYLLGGLEFYEKRLERNKALRNLVKNGKKYYDESGDELFYLKPQGFPNFVKVKLVQEKIDQFKFNKEVYTPPPVNPNPHPIR